MTADLRALMERATPGPWATEEYGYTISSSFLPDGAENIAHLYDGEYIENVRCAYDAALIVAAINALPALLDKADAHDALVERVAALEAALRPFADDLFSGEDWADDLGGPETMASAGMVRAARALLKGQPHE